MELLSKLRQEYEAGLQFKQGRVKDWKSNEDLYFGKVKQNLKGRINIPIPIMSGFIDTLISKIDDPPTLTFEGQEEADYRRSLKIQSMYEHDKLGSADEDDAGWDSKDIDGKKLCSLYGRAIFKAYAESDPEYRFCLNTIDPYDFFIDPRAGGYTERAQYLGVDNVFKSKEDLKAGVKYGYDKKAVEQLINGTSDETLVNNDDVYHNKQNRMQAIGLDGLMFNYSPAGMYKLIEQGTVYEGERWYVLWSYESNIIIKQVKLKEMFKSNLWWFISWAAYRDSFNFWSKSPADDVRPLSEAIRLLLNQEMENRQKTNWNMRAYDPNMFNNPAELQYRPDGLVSVSSEYVKTKAIANGIYEFTTPQLNGTINLVSFLDNMLGTKAGISNAAQGQADDDKVGIYYGNIQQVADRLGSFNKSYSTCWKGIGRRYVWGLKEHLPKKQAVKILGRKGIEWDFLMKEEINPDMDIVVKSSNAEAEQDAVKQKQRSETLSGLATNPAYLQKLNADWVIEQQLLNAGYNTDEVKEALDKDYFGNRELMAEAAESIDMFVRGKVPKLNNGATPAFLQKIIDFARDNTDGKDELFMKLIDYADAHSEIVMKNLGKLLNKEVPMVQNPELGQMGPQDGSEIMPEGPGATASQSAGLSEMLTPAMPQAPMI